MIARPATGSADVEEMSTTAAATRGRTANIRAFILSDIVTQFGAGMVLSASAWYVFDNSHSNAMVGLTAAFNTVSGVAMSLVAGTIVDRYSPKVVAQASHLIRVALIVAPLLLLAHFGFHPPFVFLLALNNGLGWNLYFPASKSIIQRLAGPDGTVGINSAAEVSMQVGLFSSGAIAGILYRGVGFDPILVASAVAFIIGIGILARVQVPALVPDREGNGAGNRAEGSPESFLRSFRMVFRFLADQPIVIALAFALYAPFIVANIFSTVLPGYVDVELRAGSVAYGFIDMAWGLGATLAGLGVALVARRSGEHRIIVIALATLTAFGITMMVGSSVPLAVAVTAIAGACAAASRILLYSDVMRVVPGAYLGRVMALANLVSLLLQTALAQGAGLLMDATQPRFGFALGAAVGLAAGLVYASAAPRNSRPAATTTRLEG